MRETVVTYRCDSCGAEATDEAASRLWFFFAHEGPTAPTITRLGHSPLTLRVDRQACSPPCAQRLLARISAELDEKHSL